MVISVLLCMKIEEVPGARMENDTRRARLLFYGAAAAEGRLQDVAPSCRGVCNSES